MDKGEHLQTYCSGFAGNFQLGQPLVPSGRIGTAIVESGPASTVACAVGSFFEQTRPTLRGYQLSKNLDRSRRSQIQTFQPSADGAKHRRQAEPAIICKPFAEFTWGSNPVANILAAIKGSLVTDICPIPSFGEIGIMETPALV